MITLTNLTLGSNQTAQANLADGTTVTLVFFYRPGVQRWFFNVSYPTANYADDGLGLSTNWNLLRRMRFTLPFGLQVLTADRTDPFLPSDLAPGAGGVPPRVTVNVLDSTNGRTDVEDVENAYFSGSAPRAL